MVPALPLTPPLAPLAVPLTLRAASAALLGAPVEVAGMPEPDGQPGAVEPPVGSPEVLPEVLPEVDGSVLDAAPVPVDEPAPEEADVVASEGDEEVEPPCGATDVGLGCDEPPW